MKNCLVGHWNSKQKWGGEKRGVRGGGRKDYRVKLYKLII